jgi:methionine aminopeptidase
VSINSSEELPGLRAAGRIVRRMIEAMKQRIGVGVTAAEPDEVGARVMPEPIPSCSRQPKALHLDVAVRPPYNRDVRFVPC